MLLCTVHTRHQYTPDLTLMCNVQSRTHREREAHVCVFGTACRDVRDEVHVAKFIHVALPPCPRGDRCDLMLDEVHLRTMSHGGVRDIRKRCDREACGRRYEKVSCRKMHAMRGEFAPDLGLLLWGTQRGAVRSLVPAGARFGVPACGSAAARLQHL